MARIRPAAVAGFFYPDDPDELAVTVGQQLDDARQPPTPDVNINAIKAVIVPHAGYVYSGIIAAEAYLLLAKARERIRRVILLGPVHRVPVQGVALPEADAFQTPLGDAPVDDLPDGLPPRRDGTRHELPQLIRSAEAHAQEHSLEVQIPFLQTVLPGVPIVPLAVGGVSAEQVADVLDALWGGIETVIVVSSDLSHYLPYDQALEIDEITIDAILRRAAPINHDQACGATPINGLLVAAERHDLRPSLLAACNSGDTAGDKRRVVGYSAFAFEAPGI